jgi:hypothetical protein
MVWCKGKAPMEEAGSSAGCLENAVQVSSTNRSENASRVAEPSGFMVDSWHVPPVAGHPHQPPQVVASALATVIPSAIAPFRRTS